ncbi:MAG: SiaB family protein kinase [Fibromonadales bacterium]|nr:SiaB family protein kinase [Fibromonadales bacterium]MCL2261094.1 SiaB family protein kinase [Fibromonadales bacterium]
MNFNIRQYSQMLADHNIEVIYSGPIWAGGIDGMAEMLQKRLEYEDLPFSASQSVFSVFVEQMNNMLMYSAEKDRQKDPDGKEVETSKGIYILGIKDATYFVQTGNVVTPNSANILKTRIDHLNTLDKKALRQFYKQQMMAENDNPESKGAGIGLIEIARRSSTPIKYQFEDLDNGLLYFTMYVTIKQGGKE